ncbi:MAG TPA: WS/DGAT domain-containing protein [Burkholderiaceae bacterium]|nr:WS/DGAT domain-containing protein [Burkholderiaceae bacterium]
MGTFGNLIPKDFPSLGSPWLLSGLASLHGRSGLAHRLRVANVTISNVPGPQVPLYLAGAQMAGLYPLSIVVHGVALNITVQSYMGQLCFGLIACGRAMPDVRDLAESLERAMQSARALPVPATAAADEAAAPALVAVPPATKRRNKPRLAVVKAAQQPVKAPAKAPRATRLTVPHPTPVKATRAAPAGARRRAA